MTLLPLSTRGLGAPLRAGLPPVGPGLAGQRPHGAPAPRALLVGVLRGLRGRRPHCGRDPLPAAGAALQPLAEVPPAEGRQQQLVARRQRCTLDGGGGGGFSKHIWNDEMVCLENAAALVREAKCVLDLSSRYFVVVVSNLREGVSRSSSARTSFRAGCWWETHYCLTNCPAGFREIADSIENN